jgi:hypothetical protein
LAGNVPSVAGRPAAPGGTGIVIVRYPV